MILTPVITPTLDVDVGRDRPTTQLVKITKELGFILLDHIIIGNDYYSMKMHHGFLK